MFEDKISDVLPFKEVINVNACVVDFYLLEWPPFFHLCFFFSLALLLKQVLYSNFLFGWNFTQYETDASKRELQYL